MYDLPRENVKVERDSTFTFTRDLPYRTSILHVLACHLKITRQWKSTLSKPAKPAGSSARAKFWQRAVKPFGEWGAYALTLFRAMAASLAKVSHAQNNSASYA